MRNQTTVLFPTDLYGNKSAIKNDKIFLVEEPIYYDRHSKQLGGLKFNILKPIYHRATMRNYYDELIEKGLDATYIGISDDWVKVVDKYIASNDSNLRFYDTVDRNLEKKIKKYFKNYTISATPRFILSHDELSEYNGVLRQTSFYSWMRNRTKILMNGSKPIGGKLTFDTSNRLPPYKGIDDDLIKEKTYTDNKYVKEAYKYVVDNIAKKNLYQVDDFELKFPTSRHDSLIHLRGFIRNKLSVFGAYEDAIVANTTNSMIFHSGISPMLNIGLLTPMDVIEEIIKAYESDKKLPLSSVEGFVRQILGWREFCRYMYVVHPQTYTNKNYFKATKSLSVKWYNATTGFQPVDDCIKKAFKYGYLHHIERLMIVANHMTLCGINPKKMYVWFMEFALDSYDWVMEYNIYCMASYSDGGATTTKPYISSSNYILRMSNYPKKSDWIEGWDELFWAFIKKHKEKIKKIYRLSALTKYV